MKYSYKGNKKFLITLIYLPLKWCYHVSLESVFGVILTHIKARVLDHTITQYYFVA